MGGQWFNIGKKDEVRTNYVEITPEQQAEIDKANKAAQNAELSQGLSNKQPDLGKGISVQSQQQRVDTGNGITRIMNPDGSVEFEIDYAKGYDGSPQMFAKGTKVTYLNQPQGSEKGFLAKLGEVIDSMNEWGNRVTGGQIRRLGSGIATTTAVASAAAAGVAAGAAASTVTVGKIATGGVVALSAVACGKDDFTPDKPGVGIVMNPKDVAQSAVNSLNEIHSMDDLLSTIDINYNNAINQAKTQELKNKLAAQRDAILQELENANLDLSSKTSDGVSFEYGLQEGVNNTFRPYITIPGSDVKIYLPGQVNDSNVVDYIDVAHEGGNSFKTSDDVTYQYKIDDKGNAEVAFGNGISHTVGDNVDIKDTSPMGKMYSMLGRAGFEQPATNQVLLGFKPNEQGSFGNAAQGFDLSLVTPANLRTITDGNPQVKGKIGGIEFNGQVAADNNGNITITDGDKVVTISQVKGSIDIGKPDSPDVYNEGVVVTLPDGTQYFMTPHGDGATDIGKIDRINGTTLQYYQNNSTTFDTQGAADADKYFYDRETSLNDATKTATTNYNFFNRVFGGASAQVTVR